LPATSVLLPELLFALLSDDAGMACAPNATNVNTAIAAAKSTNPLRIVISLGFFQRRPKTS
jgi:hypothetical protein